jgi:hypothetical protein
VPDGIVRIGGNGICRFHGNGFCRFHGNGKCSQGGLCLTLILQKVSIPCNCLCHTEIENAESANLNVLI